MSGLAQLAEKALANPASQPAIEFATLWINWGNLRQLAERVAALLVASGTAPGANVALVVRNHPSAIAAFIGLIAKSYSIRMIYPFQSAAGNRQPRLVITPRRIFSGSGGNCRPATGAVAVRQLFEISK